MRYWTIQALESWEEAENSGYLEGNKDYLMYPEEYKWMIARMSKRLPNYDGSYPVWVWLKKPDMRGNNHFEGGGKCVRLTLDLDPEDVLLSDFDDWHCILNNTFNAVSEDEWDKFYAGELQMTKEQSWERIFDLELQRDPIWSGDAPRVLQGVTGKVTLDKVKKVEHFVARQQPKWM
ncbi:DUF3841 domain-containing protein [Paenibacillus azoreducens]|uniref:DUF3841 domain-containing protein n=1 Tax=Paenibacillus azoreducens TaxID=116718 RepID=A0A919YH08_9BACL|nr:DUF3841 domain-containing protein [Paenibacillus azoreducens]GIO50599.1 hypothetical protein J34TS1_53640 [Paenibacillus azoreducens]